MGNVGEILHICGFFFKLMHNNKLKTLWLEYFSKLKGGKRTLLRPESRNDK